MTPNKVIEKIDKVKPNLYDDETKLGWITKLDGMVKRLVMQEEELKPYSYPDDMDTELLIPFPFDDVYEQYVSSMIDYHNQEYDNYNNSATMFEQTFAEYKKAYIRQYPAKG